MNTQPALAHGADPFAGLPVLIGVPRAAELIGISRATAYRCAATGEWRTKRIGRRVYVFTDGLREFLSKEATAA